MATNRTELVPAAVFGHSAFCEVGEPSVLAVSRDGMLAVGGTLGLPQWNGFDVRASPVNGTGPVRGWNRCGVYGPDATCIALVPTRWPIRTAAFSEDGSLLVVGTGSYDGGYCFEGELLIVDPLSGDARSVLEARREVLGAEWVDSRQIRVVVSPAYEEGEPQEPSEFTLFADDWSTVPARSIPLSSAHRYLPGYAPESSTGVRSALQRAASQAGLDYELRRQVWAVESTDFGVLAALEGVELEAWERSGSLRYRRDTTGRGRQIERHSSRTVLTNVEPPWGGPATGFERLPSVVNLVDVASGESISSISTDAPVVVTAAEGRALLRGTDGWGARSDRSWIVGGVNWSTSFDVPLAGYDLFNHYFSVRKAPAVFALEGARGRASSDKWVVRVGPEPSASTGPPVVDRLFALEWDRARDGQLMGGPGVFVDDGDGPAIIHSGWVHNGAGLLPGNAFVVRRRYPDGELRWQHHADCQATALDESNGMVLVAFADGRIVRLDAATGVVVQTHDLRVFGHSVVPLSLCCTTTGDVYIGTMDGRVLVVN